ncbi:MAG: DUF167 domain-containing protein [Planctomycetes bacterium]|nr:DUF167 domain-containing protein [Planctomycetota bacterium]
MIINIKVVSNARQNKVKKEPGRLKVYVTAPAQDGKANQAVIAALAKHYLVKKNRIAIVRGEKYREKVIRIQKC